MVTNSELLRVTFTPRFKSKITQIKLDDVDGGPRLVKLSNLAQLTRDGEEIERGDSLKEIKAEISWCERGIGTRRC